MGAADLMDDIWCALAADADFLAFKGLNPDSDETDKMAYMVKSQQTDGVVTSDSVPIVLMYEMPGALQGSSYIYAAFVALAFYANESNAVRQMADRAKEVLSNWTSCGSAFSCQFIRRTSFATGIPGVEGFRAFFQFNQFTG